MSLTVSQLMELPCLRRAKVLAGKKGLNRIVATISVLEYATPTAMQKKLYDSIEFWGSELVITGHRAHCEIVQAADYVTRFQKEKHPFDRGIPARKGIEY